MLLIERMYSDLEQSTTEKTKEVIEMAIGFLTAEQIIDVLIEQLDDDDLDQVATALERHVVES